MKNKSDGWKRHIEEDTIKSILDDCIMEELKDFARRLGLARISSLRKRELIERIRQALTEPLYLEEYLMTLSLYEWKNFKKLIEAPYLEEKKLGEEIFRLLDLGLASFAFDGKDFNWFILKEIRECYDKLDKSSFEKKKERDVLLQRYALSAVNFYGSITLTELVDIFNDQNKAAPTSPRELTVACKRAFRDEALIDFNISDVDDGRSFLTNILIAPEVEKAREGKPRYVPNKPTLLQYEEPLFYEKNIYTRAAKKLVTECYPTASEAEVEDLIMLFCRMIREELADAAIIFDIMPRLAFQPPEDEDIIVEFMQCFIRLHNNTRMWSNNGYTPEELLRLIPPGEEMYDARITDLSTMESYPVDVPFRAFKDADPAEDPFNVYVDAVPANVSFGGFKGNAPVSAPHDTFEGVELAPRAAARRESVKKVGRNDPCPCGSGKKYKNCCGRVLGYI